jgi:hypothetical protein
MGNCKFGKRKDVDVPGLSNSNGQGEIPSDYEPENFQITLREVQNSPRSARAKDIFQNFYKIMLPKLKTHVENTTNYHNINFENRLS